MEMMRLRPVGKDYLWGGNRLTSEFGKNINISPLAETWECSVHPDGVSTVTNGTFAGMTLDRVLEYHPEFLGTKHPDELPILIKFIDAAQDLSVQVHPDDAYAQAYEHQNGKTEMWYVLDAQPDAELIYGFAHEMSKSQVQAALTDGSLMEHLRRVPAKTGDTFYIPAGTVHAIGKGLLIAEIQENSNVTYRVYDYDRRDKYGHTRELHTRQALDVMTTCVQPLQTKPVHTETMPDYILETLCYCPYFMTDKITVKNGYEFEVMQESFQVILCIAGNGTLHDGENTFAVQKGDCLFLPAGLGKCCAEGTFTMLKVTC